MGLRRTLITLLGGTVATSSVAADTAPLPAPDVAALARAATMETLRQVLPALSPAGQPVPSNAPRPPIYALDNPIYYSTPQTPTRRPKALVSVDTLRQLADTYDPLRSCINHLKREVATTPFEIVARDGKDKSDATKKRVEIATNLFARTGPVGGVGKHYARFEGEMLEDVTIVGASAIFHQRNRGGGWMGCETIDAATIRPVVDAYGWTPAPESGTLPYEQWIQGGQVARLAHEDLDFDGIYWQSRSPYPVSPVEWLIRVVNAALRADEWNVAWLTDGNTPSDVYSLPETWTPEQVMTFAGWWDGLLSGNTSARQKTKFVPGGTKNVGTPSRKDQEFTEYELWLLRRTCSLMGVSPASIGYVGEQYKVSQDASMSQTSQFGAGTLLAYRKARLDDILERAGFGDLETRDVEQGQDDAKTIADTAEVEIRSGQKTINEVRQERGLDAIEGGDTLLVPSSVQPLARAIEPPEPPPAPIPDPEDNTDPAEATRADWRRWQEKALRRLKTTSNAACTFESDCLPAAQSVAVCDALSTCGDAEAVRGVFRPHLEKSNL